VYVAAAAAIGAALAAAAWLPFAPAAAAILAPAVGLTLFTVIVPWTQMATPRAHRAHEDAILAQAARFLETGDRADLPDPDRHRDPRLHRLAATIDDLGRMALRAGRRNRYLSQSIDHAVEARTRKATHALHREASTDPLTGLGNRRRLDEALASMFSDAARRRDDTVAAILIDLDHFKQVNDQLGHAVGDECLRFVGELLASTLRGEDVAVRLGGDEFVVLLPSLGEREAASVGRRITELHRQRLWPHETTRPPTLSLGVAAVHRAIENGPEVLLERADAALYAVKGSGRDAVATWADRVADPAHRDARRIA
jgi:diguanylate cyclase (GGDEF)-like protein